MYVHFPWCLAKCPYCDFLSLPAPRETLPHRAYADAVLAELAEHAAAIDPGGRVLASVFFGGGTPSLWDPAELGRVLGRIVDTFPAKADDVEITVECNPSSFDRERARALLDVGVNRVSIGVQGLDDERLQFLGRLHDGRGGLRAVGDALSAGVPRVSADLIFGVAGMSADDAVREATTVADLGVTHLSAYALTIEQGTQFGALARKGRLPLLGDDVVADSFTAVHGALSDRSFAHYEISNYARHGHEARHNLGYWRGDDYLGLGCGAWGTVRVGGERIRYRNTPSPDRYVLRATEPPSHRDPYAGPSGRVTEVERLAPDTELRERLMLGLRLASGVDVEEAARAVGAEPWPEERARNVERLVGKGRLLRDGSRLVIPPGAWLFADGTIAELL